MSIDKQLPMLTHHCNFPWNRANLQLRRKDVFGVKATQLGRFYIFGTYSHRGGLAGVLWPKATRLFLANAKHSPVQKLAKSNKVCSAMSMSKGLDFPRTSSDQ